MLTLITLAAIMGAALNAQGRRAGFAVWIVTNAYFAIHNLRIGETQQAALYAVYFALAVWGLVKWRGSNVDT